MTALLLAALIGKTVHFHDRITGQLMCGKLSTIDQYDRAWILPDTNPQWYAIEPAAIVKEGCPR